MTTTHDDNATTWRDLADQLTPTQIAKLEEFEQRWTSRTTANITGGHGCTGGQCQLRRAGSSSGADL
jgi:hypothetical protein